MTRNTSFNTIMAGLNCGIPSKNAWEIIKTGCDAVIKISDEEVYWRFDYQCMVWHSNYLNAR